MVKESELAEFLKKNPPAKKFVPYCHLSQEADTLTVYFEGDPDYSERLNDHITLYLSLATHEPVGCRIKGISGILADLPNYIHCNHSSELSILFLPFRGGAKDEKTRSVLNDLAREAADRKMVLETAI